MVLLQFKKWFFWIYFFCSLPRLPTAIYLQSDSNPHTSFRFPPTSSPAHTSTHFQLAARLHLFTHTSTDFRLPAYAPHPTPHIHHMCPPFYYHLPADLPIYIRTGSLTVHDRKIVLRIYWILCYTFLPQICSKCQMKIFISIRQISACFYCFDFPKYVKKLDDSKCKENESQVIWHDLSILFSV